MVDFRKFCSDEWIDWYRLTPLERWEESAKLFELYLLLGGTSDPQPDTQSPFFDRQTSTKKSAHGGAGLHFLRRSGV